MWLEFWLFIGSILLLASAIGLALWYVPVEDPYEYVLKVNRVSRDHILGHGGHRIAPLTQKNVVRDIEVDWVS